MIADYGVTREMLVEVSLKNQHMGALNPYAHVEMLITKEGILDSPHAVVNNPPAATPLHLYDLCPVSDGAAAVILCPLERVKELSKNVPVMVAGFGQATDTHTLAERDDPTDLKAVTLAALMRVFLTLFPGMAASLAPVLAVLAALTMIVGNLLAILQTNIKRLLAFSSIANAGYLLMAFSSYGKAEIASQVVGSMLFFLTAYALTSLGAWAVVIALEKPGGRGLELDDYSGLGRKYPWLAVPMLIFMLSFTGMPLTLGFWGKFYLFKTAIDGGYLWLAIVGLITSVVSAYYYLRVVMVMFMKAGDPEAAPDPWGRVLVAGLAAAVVLLSLLPGRLLELAAQAILRL
mgnify:CR=1 FL=1